MTDPETLTLRTTVIAGKRYDDDFTVIWRGLSIGRIMQSSGVPDFTDQWPAPGMKQNTVSSSMPLRKKCRPQRWLRPSGLSRSYSIFPRRNVGPITFTHLAGDPIAVL